MVLGDIHTSRQDLTEASVRFDMAAEIVTEKSSDLFHVVQIKRANVLMSSERYAEAQ